MLFPSIAISKKISNYWFRFGFYLSIFFFFGITKLLWPVLLADSRCSWWLQKATGRSRSCTCPRWCNRSVSITSMWRTAPIFAVTVGDFFRMCFFLGKETHKNRGIHGNVWIWMNMFWCFCPANVSGVLPAYDVRDALPFFFSRGILQRPKTCLVLEKCFEINMKSGNGTHPRRVWSHWCHCRDLRTIKVVIPINLQ